MSKYALVTGGSRGLGRAVCLALSRSGWQVIINYRSGREAAEETLRQVTAAGGTGELLPFDVADAEAATAALDKWTGEHPGEAIQCVVNNAGIRKDNLLVFMPRADWSAVTDITLRGFYNVTQPLLKPMLVKKHGRIINMVSVTGQAGMAGQTNYAAAKGAIIAATKSLAKEVARKHVTVNCVAPGFIHSDMTADLDEKELSKGIPAGRFGEPEEVAHLVAFLASDEADYITGQTIGINGGLYA